ncbi:MAG: hypothetical protein RDV41_14660, partial [Planctomycetota bacterium]|nr:hypothetical protein [Planctomycetota bacterium]
MLRRIAVVAVFCLLAHCAWAQEAEAPKTGGPFEVELTKPSTKYWLYVPEDYTKNHSLPLMVALHGAGSDAKSSAGIFHSEAARNKFVLCGVKSTGEAWEDGDGALILAVMDDVKKKYSIDPDRIFLTGYSSGGFMASRFGFKNHARFRGVCMIAGAMIEGGGKPFKEAAAHMCALVVCGTLDPNMQCCDEAFKKLQKSKFDVEFNKVEGMEHSPLKSEVIPWIFEKFNERLGKPEDLLIRGKNAVAQKRYADAIEWYHRVIVDALGEKFQKIAEQELGKLEKKANEELTKALKKCEKDQKGGLQMLKDLAEQYDGVEAADKAKEKIKELEGGGTEG